MNMCKFIRIFMVLAGLSAVNSALAVENFAAKDSSLTPRKMVIYSSLDANFVNDIVEQFQEGYKNIEVEYHELQTFDIYEKVVQESDENGVTVDFVFSSAMDLQMKLANDGYAQSVDSAALQALPPFAQWRNMAFGLTNEPSVVVYNKKWFKDKKLPKSHDDLTKFLNDNNQDIYNKIATYDIERAGVGLFFMAQDQKHNKNIWPLINAMGAAGVRLYSNSSAILQRVADGRFVLGYNILGSYAKIYAKSNPDLGIIMPDDYTIIMSRIGLVPRLAKQADLGKLFLQFLVSEQGQILLKEQTSMLSLSETLQSAKFRHVRIGPSLVVYQDQLKRQKLIRKWNEMLKQN